VFVEDCQIDEQGSGTEGDNRILLYVFIVLLILKSPLKDGVGKEVREGLLRCSLQRIGHRCALLSNLILSP